MDGSRFDDLTLRIAASRRGAVKGLLAVAAAGVLGRLSRQGADAACRALGRTCSEHVHCCSGRCGRKDLTGRRRCECRTAADCPAPTNTCQTAACVAGQCSTSAKPNGTGCDDGDSCTENDTCQNGTCRPGTPKTCPPCQTCRNGDCRSVVSDARCTGSCIDGTCVAACLPVKAVCDLTANTCCQDVAPAQCSVEANCRADQSEARCCRPFGAACSERCDCCSNAECIGGICGLGPGQQCLDRTECGEFGSECCNGICRTLANDPTNCGACGRVCPPPPSGGIARCDTFNCTVECTGGRSLCNGACRDLDGDEDNCGVCGHACAAGATCCFGVCRDLRADERNCGLCNLSCGINETCCNGTCTDLLFDANNCTFCGGSCAQALCGQDSCPGLNVACCFGNCANLNTSHTYCGNCDRICGGDERCEGGVCVET